MRLFADIQKIVGAGTKQKVSVPASKSLIVTNKTKAPVILYTNSSSKIGYPLEKKESLEVQDITEETDFYVLIEDTEIIENEGLFLISQTPLSEAERVSRNTVIVQNK
ncbi:hypothetical protein QUH73_04325 [Labilibaculum sp. K2S]|uniref:hypothetical protein n=1 Tax=Labilibaculum sp. K2S TaxID=3056386 RepID=UPI0025A4A353|nr:hypothetical protein [Labilibaculum sp. K2S]MDM8159041.1 hypothetical protein [Labilibaculum sp. K2S]